MAFMEAPSWRLRHGVAAFPHLLVCSLQQARGSIDSASTAEARDLLSCLHHIKTEGMESRWACWKDVSVGDSVKAFLLN